jgi:hypothetical protein
MTTPGLNLLAACLAGGLAVVSGLGAETMEKAEHYPDHIVVGIADLELGMDRIEELTGVRPAYGGSHPHIGTHNALISLGTHSYLEIIAPNPDPDPATLDPVLRAQFMDPLLSMPGLKPFLWAVGSTDLDRTRSLLARDGIQLSEPAPGARKKPDGSLLEWRASFVIEPRAQPLPFFIQWVDPSVAPPTDSPAGCLLAGIAVSGPDIGKLKRMIEVLSLQVTPIESESPGIQVSLDCPKGKITL